MADLGLPFQPAQDRVVISDPVLAASWLAQEMALSFESFDKATEQAKMEWGNRTVFDAPGFAGTTFWGVCVRHLRWILSALGWITNNDGNLSRAIHPDGTQAIVTETGDENTGIVGTQPPKTKSPKGQQIDAAISANLMSQPELFPADEKARLELIERRAQLVKTYIFLIRIAPDGRVYRELSLPVRRSGSNQIDDWRLRVIFPPIGGDGGPPLEQMPLPEPGPEPTINITRRTA
jgi:hypothetical protein